MKSNHRSEPVSEGIKQIVFDFGGVILDIDHARVEQEFRNLGVADFQSLYNKASQSELFKEFEMGKISEERFRDEIRQVAGLGVSDEILDRTWNAILGDYPPHRINLLSELRKNYRIFLFSNTNSIHYRFYVSSFRQKYGYELESLFDYTFWSFREGFRKPDQSAYRRIEEVCGLIPEEMLFIDDTAVNVSAARMAGWNALLLNEGEEVGRFFANGRVSNTAVERIKKEKQN
ncbi:MAG: HAD family phosphatase [Bacteroidales bacterium]